MMNVPSIILGDKKRIREIQLNLAYQEFNCKDLYNFRITFEIELVLKLTRLNCISKGCNMDEFIYKFSFSIPILEKYLI